MRFHSFALHPRPLLFQGHVGIEPGLIAQQVLASLVHPGVSVLAGQLHGLAGHGVSVILHSAHRIAERLRRLVVNAPAFLAAPGPARMQSVITLLVMTLLVVVLGDCLGHWVRALRRPGAPALERADAAAAP